MSFQERNRRDEAYSRFRGTQHLVMGILYIGVGLLVLYIKYFGAIALSAGMAYAIGVLMLVYGVFRLWRGIAFMRQQRRQD